jgi:hypothetical protein
MSAIHDMLAGLHAANEEGKPLHQTDEQCTEMFVL